MKLRMPEMPPATLLAALGSYNLLPAIVFLPTRRRCDEAASEAALSRRSAKDDRHEARRDFMNSLVEQHPEIRKHRHWDTIVRGGIASHHAGHLPAWKLVIEKMMSAGLLDAIFATATVAARFGCECVIYMGKVDMERQALNVARMKFLGAKVVPVTVGQATLKEAINEAMRDWVTNVRTTHYILGSVLGSHPYPMMVRDFQSVIGIEARRQILEREERLPDLLVACVGGGSNAIGLFHPFLQDREVRMIGVEAGGEGIRSGKHAARFQGGRLGVLQGTKTFLLANEEGQIELTHSVSAGLDYAAVGPEHSYLRDLGRVEYTYATDDEALNAFRILSETEGIIPALETAHAIAYLIKNAPNMKREEIVIVNCSGRGDKDVDQAAAAFGLKEKSK